MKLTTIWTLPVMSLGTRLFHTKEWVAQTFADKLPKRVKFWAAMMVIAKAVDVKDRGIDTITVGELLERIERPKGLYDEYRR